MPPAAAITHWNVWLRSDLDLYPDPDPDPSPPWPWLQMWLWYSKPFGRYGSQIFHNFFHKFLTLLWTWLSPRDLQKNLTSSSLAPSTPKPKSDEISSINFQDIKLTEPKSVFSWCRSPPWPWTFSFWPQKFTRSSLSQNAPKVLWKCPILFKILC